MESGQSGRKLWPWNAATSIMQICDKKVARREQALLKIVNDLCRKELENLYKGNIVVGKFLGSLNFNKI